MNQQTNTQAAEFTEQAIRALYAKTRTGADFPRLIQDLKKLGVVSYDHIVATGANVFHSVEGESLPLKEMGVAAVVSDRADAAALKRTIVEHQKGLTNYPQVCGLAGQAGVAKWTSDVVAMTCTYFDKAGQSMLAEPIPTGGY